MPTPLLILLSTTTILILILLPTPTLSSPSLAILSDTSIHLIPHHALFLRQVTDLRTFTENLASAGQASSITASGDPKQPFLVDGEKQPDFKTAVNRSCDNQKALCAKKANEGGQKNGLSVSDCDKQRERCLSTQLASPVQDFDTAVQSKNIGPDKDFPEFDLICDA